MPSTSQVPPPPSADRDEMRADEQHGDRTEAIGIAAPPPRSVVPVGSVPPAGEPARPWSSSDDHTQAIPVGGGPAWTGHPGRSELDNGVTTTDRPAAGDRAEPDQQTEPEQQPKQQTEQPTEPEGRTEQQPEPEGRAEQQTEHEGRTEQQTDPAAGLRPGDATAAGPELAQLWDDDEVTRFRTRWREAQLQFVDDPRAATGDARQLATEAVEAVTAALTKHREGIEAAHPEDGDTEYLRVVMRRYRDFLDRVLDL